MSKLINNHLRNGYSDYNLLFLKKYKMDLKLDYKILDVGCGHYRNLFLFYQIGFKKLYGIDKATPDPSQKPDGFNVDFIEKDILLGLPYNSQQFEIVLCNFVLMFIPGKSIQQILNELLRVTSMFCIIETYKQFTEVKNGQVTNYSFKEIVSYIEERSDFEVLDKKVYKEKLIIRRIQNG